MKFGFDSSKKYTCKVCNKAIKLSDKNKKFVKISYIISTLLFVIAEFFIQSFLHISIIYKILLLITLGVIIVGVDYSEVIF
jgi:hypothetical protein